MRLLKPLLQILDPPLRRLAYVARLADPPRSVVERGGGIPCYRFRLAYVPLRRLDLAPAPICGLVLAPAPIRGFLLAPLLRWRPVLASLLRRHPLPVRGWRMIVWRLGTRPPGPLRRRGGNGHGIGHVHAAKAGINERNCQPPGPDSIGGARIGKRRFQRGLDLTFDLVADRLPACAASRLAS